MMTSPFAAAAGTARGVTTEIALQAEVAAAWMRVADEAAVAEATVGLPTVPWPHMWDVLSAPLGRHRAPDWEWVERATAAELTTFVECCEIASDALLRQQNQRQMRSQTPPETPPPSPPAPTSLTATAADADADADADEPPTKKRRSAPALEVGDQVVMHKSKWWPNWKLKKTQVDVDAFRGVVTRVGATSRRDVTVRWYPVDLECRDDLSVNQYDFSVMPMRRLCDLQAPDFRVPIEGRLTYRQYHATLGA